MLYATSYGNELVALYRRIEKEQGTISIKTKEGYGTFYSEKPFIVPEGIEAGIISDVAGNELTINYLYPAGSTVPANTALIVKGESMKDYNFYYTDCSIATPMGNKLYGKNGVDETGQTNVEGADRYYIMNYGSNGLGFYYAVEGGGPTQYRSGCFLALSSSDNIQATSLIFGNEISSIENIKPEDSSSTIYTIEGTKVNGSTLSPGIYIVNGKKLLVK